LILRQVSIMMRSASIPSDRSRTLLKNFVTSGSRNMEQVASFTAALIGTFTFRSNSGVLRMSAIAFLLVSGSSKLSGQSEPLQPTLPLRTSAARTARMPSVRFGRPCCTSGAEAAVRQQAAAGPREPSRQEARDSMLAAFKLVACWGL
jgi:hypothetical protein